MAHWILPNVSWASPRRQPIIGSISRKPQDLGHLRSRTIWMSSDGDKGSAGVKVTFVTLYFIEWHCNQVTCSHCDQYQVNPMKIRAPTKCPNPLEVIMPSWSPISAFISNTGNGELYVNLIRSPFLLLINWIMNQVKVSDVCSFMVQIMLFWGHELNRIDLVSFFFKVCW